MTDKFKIEKNVPLSAKKQSKQAKYQFAKMQVGDSFVVPAEEYTSLANAMQHWQRKHKGQLFKMRTIDHKVRCWRIK